MKKSYNYKKGGQMMKKVINVFLTIIMACVVVLLVISLSIRTISTKTISNAFFGSLTVIIEKNSKSIDRCFIFFVNFFVILYRIFSYLVL